jgi:selenocysteine-specific elongation factor
VEVAEAPTRLAVNLAGVPLEAVNRGDVLTSDSTVTATKVVDVAFWPAAGDGKRGPRLGRGTVVSMYVGTARSAAKARPAPLQAVETAGDTAADVPAEVAGPSGSEPRFVRLRLAHPLVVFGGDRYVLRGAEGEGPAGAVIGGGVVLDARAARARLKEKRVRVLRALDAGDGKEAALALAAEASPRPFAPAGLSSRFKIGEAALSRAADKLVADGTLVRLKNGALALRSRLLEMAAAARALVVEHHRSAPLDRGLPLETLRRQLAVTSSAEAADEAIRLAARKGAVAGEPILVEGDVARSPGMERASEEAAGGALGKALRAMEETGLRGLSEAMMREATGATPKEVKAILAKLTREGVAMTAGELWFSKKAVDGLKARIADHMRGTARLTIADLKTISGLGRRQVIPLLEAFDRDGFTRRDGDDRVPGPAFPKS